MNYHKIIRSFSLLAFLSVGVLASCGNGNNSSENSAAGLMAANAHAVGNASKLNDLFEESQKTGGNYYYPGMNEDVTASSAETGAQGSGSRDYTDTNEQVEGVSEADIVKTDGYQIYYAARYENKIRVLDVEDDHSIHVGTMIDLGQVYTDSLYLTPNYLIVIGYRYDVSNIGCATDDEGDTAYCLSYMWWQPTGTAVIIDRDTLDIVYSLETDSFFMDHRLINDSLFLVGYKYHYYGDDDARPYFTEIKGDSEETSFVDYSDIYYFDDTPAYGMKVLTGVKLNADPELIEHNSSAFLGASPDYQKMYVNLDHLVLAETIYHYEENEYYNRMTISQFALDIAHATLSFEASASLAGTSLNQFSMDEYEGNLRVATTDRHTTWSVVSEWWGWSSTSVVTNHLYILKANEDAGFDLVGHLSEGLGKPGEEIKSVRFDGPTAYIVTFLNTDPLYIIDLSDPTNPVVGGEIEQLGFDTYQHIWGENRLLGIGYNAGENGGITGMKISAYNTASGEEETIQTLSLFSYSNVDDTSWEYGYSEALWNHKALLISVEDGIIAFPVQAYEYGYKEVADGTSGEYVYNDGEKTYEWFWNYHSYYYIFHIDFNLAKPISEPFVIEHDTSNDYYVSVDRGILIEGIIYTISNREVVSYSVADKALYGEPLVF